MIKLKNISIVYENETILKNLNLDFTEQKIYCISGPSGCGKSSILNIISLLSDNYEGEYQLMEDKNINIYSKKAKQYRINTFSYLFQDLALLEDKSVMYNLKLVTKDEAVITSILSDYNMIELKDKKISTLSGGQKHRVAFIRMLIQDNQLILLDEPGNNLDKENKLKLLSDIKSLKNKTIIIVSHDPDVWDICDYVYNLVEKHEEINN